MPWIVYKHTNNTNNKVYIGLTKKTIMKRWYEHVSSANKKDCRASMYHFHRAISKYGKDNCTHEVLVDGIQTIEEASTLEIEFIKLYDSVQNGYNKTDGGVTGYSYSKYPKTFNSSEKDISKTTKENYMFINKHTKVIEVCTRSELCDKYNLNRSHLAKVFKGSRTHTGGWSLLNEHPKNTKETHEQPINS